MTRPTSAADATVAVIGAGQAGLSAAHHLRRRGFRALSGVQDLRGDDGRTVVVFDANQEPGGAWQHRWASLRMATVNGIHDLPGMPRPPVDPAEAARSAVPRYFASYEAREDLPVLRPVRVESVTTLDDRPDGPLAIATDHGSWHVRAVVNATGTWNTPVVPDVPGAASFLGEQLHSREYVDAEHFRGKRVAVVGGGISAVQLLDEISRVTSTVWYTRREPVFLPGDFVHEVDGVDVERRVAADVRAGRPPASIVSYTGLIWTDALRDAARRGVLERRPMFTRIRPHGVVEADGTDTTVDVLLWATGYHADLGHLAPMHLRGPLGGVPVAGTQVTDEPRVHLVGYGPSQSTVGANRAGRAAARDLDRWLDTHEGTRRDGRPPSADVER